MLYGTTECRQRIDCLLGLEENYGLEFKDFKSVDPELRYEVLDNGDADLSILFTTDGQLFVDPDDVHDPRGRPAAAARGQRDRHRVAGGGGRGR